MKTASDQKSSLWIYDLALSFVLIVFFTGGEFLFPPGFKNLIAQKPWIHRALITSLMLAGFFWMFSRSRTKERSKIERGIAWLGSHPEISLWGLFILSSGVWSFSSCLRHEIFHTGFDMAIFIQVIWNTLHGNFLYSSIKGGICLLGDHFSPLLLVYTVPYAIWSDPKCLLILQAVAAASSIFPLYLIAREKLGPKSALVFAFALTQYLPLINSVRFEFHPEVPVIPICFWAFYALMEGKNLLAVVAAMIVLFSKENAALAIFGLGIYGSFALKSKKTAMGIALFSVVYFIIVIQYAIPHFFAGPNFYIEGNFMAWQKEGLGAFLRKIFSLKSVAYFFKIYAPLGFLSFLSPAFLISLPILLQNLVARNDAVQSIFFHYTAFLTPFVFISAVEGAKRFSQRNIFIVYLLGFSFAFSGISEIYVIHKALSEYRPEYSKIQNALEQIPSSASVRTHEFFAPHAAHRKNLHIYENQNPAEGGRLEALEADYVILSREYLGANADAIFNKLKETHSYLISDTKFGVFKRK